MNEDVECYLAEADLGTLLEVQRENRRPPNQRWPYWHPNGPLLVWLRRADTLLFQDGRVTPWGAKVLRRMLEELVFVTPDGATAPVSRDMGTWLHDRLLPHVVDDHQQLLAPMARELLLRAHS